MQAREIGKRYATDRPEELQCKEDEGNKRQHCTWWGKGFSDVKTYILKVSCIRSQWVTNELHNVFAQPIRGVQAGQHRYVGENQTLKGGYRNLFYSFIGPIGHNMWWENQA